jgi:magnesium transporter
VAVSPSINAVWKAVENNRFEGQRSAPRFLYRIVRTIIDRYSPIILNLEARLEELEEEMLENARDEILAELVTYNSRLRKLRRIFGYQQAVLGELKNQGGSLLGAECEHEFQDAFEQMERMASLSEMLQNLTGDLINGYISVASHHLNNIMKTLTIASVIFLPLTFLAGIYGMNFENMPELTTTFGYFAVISLMVIIATGLLLVFRRKRWL